MEYKYCENDNFEDFASGRVIYGGTSVPNFPVRLGNEIFRRCLIYKKGKDNLTVYDPCCGGGYLLTVLSMLNPCITEIVGSDIDDSMLQIAERNFSLLSQDGLAKRKQELKELAQKYGKQSHLDALNSLGNLKTLCRSGDFSYRTFHADCTKPIQDSLHPDIIITDSPYGNLVSWEGAAESPLNLMYRQLAKMSHEDTILAVIMDKKQKPEANGWLRLEKQQLGKRKFEIYRCLNN